MSHLFLPGTRQWLADALKENDPSNVLLFLVGSKKDLSVSMTEALGFRMRGTRRWESWSQPLDNLLLVDSSSVRVDGEGCCQDGPGNEGRVLGCLISHR